MKYTAVRLRGCTTREETATITNTGTTTTRKLKMAQLAHAIVAMPGGVGTLEELLEAITWRQLSISCHPIVLLNVDNYFEPLIGMLDTAIDNHLMAPDNRRLWHVASSADEAIDFLVSYNKNESRIIADKY